jgi:hypothetical protein
VTPVSNATLDLRFFGGVDWCYRPTAETDGVSAVHVWYCGTQIAFPRSFGITGYVSDDPDSKVALVGVGLSFPMDKPAAFNSAWESNSIRRSYGAAIGARDLRRFDRQYYIDEFNRALSHGDVDAARRLLNEAVESVEPQLLELMPKILVAYELDAAGYCRNAQRKAVECSAMGNLFPLVLQIIGKGDLCRGGKVTGPRPNLDHPNPVLKAKDSPYVVRDEIVLRSELVIEPGVVIKFTPEARLIISPTGRIVSQGTLTEPVIFTSIYDDQGMDSNNDGVDNPEPGDWRGFEVAEPWEKTTDGWEVQNVMVRYSNTEGPLRTVLERLGVRFEGDLPEKFRNRLSNRISSSLAP